MQTDSSSCHHFAVQDGGGYASMRRRGKGEGRVCIVEVTTGHVSYVSRAFCQAD